MRALPHKNRIWAAVLLCALLLSGCGETTPAPTPVPAATAEVTETPAPTPAPTAAPVPATEAPAPPAATTDILSQQTLPDPGATATPVPATPPPFPGGNAGSPERVDDTYFADAAFLGNSLMQGLSLFGGLQYGSFFSNTSASVVSANTVRDYKDAHGNACTLVDGLLSRQYKKIYVLFGINEIGFRIDGFIDIYSELLAQISAAEPNARIIVLSLTPITKARDRADDLFTRERIEQFNAAIETMAGANGYTYLNLYDALADEDGWLPDAQSTDGIHLIPAKYLEWAEFLRTHFETVTDSGISAD